MNQSNKNGGEAKKRAQSGWSAAAAPTLDSQYTELIETVWRCERVWKLEDRIDAVIKDGRS